VRSKICYLQRIPRGRNLRSLAFARGDNRVVCAVATQSPTRIDRGEDDSDSVEPSPLSLSCKGRGKLALVGTLLVAFTILPACNSEVLQKQAEQLKQQEEEIARQRKELDALLAGQKLQEQQRRDCNRAFREFFDKAQGTGDRDRAIALYREGLALCPDDDVAHYELGKVLADGGRYQEAEQELETALKINPGFIDAKKQLDLVRKSK
jgi:tetratricopeptide (TPR) repeat protein